MSKSLILGILFLLFCSTAFAVTAVKGRIEKIDRTAKTIVVKAADGTEHTFLFVGRTAVHGAEMAGADAFHGLKEGSEVVVHYTVRGSEETALEIDHIGEGGLKTTEGTLTRLDRNAKTFTIKAEDGTEHEFRLTEQPRKMRAMTFLKTRRNPPRSPFTMRTKPVTSRALFQQEFLARKRQLIGGARH